jgi:HEPN domain-containing protein
MPERSQNWFRQTEQDIDAVESMRRAKHFEWSCFISQQAAEKALKAVFQKLNGEARGHSLTELMKKLSDRLDVDEKAQECCRLLDKYYIPIRYPNGFDRGSPFEYYSDNEAQDAVICARRILRWGERFLA